MRFRHVDPLPVLQFLRHGTSPILVREWERERGGGGISGLLRMSKPQPAAPGRQGEIVDVEFIAGRRAPSEIGVVLRYYFHIGSTADEPILPLVEAVAHIETRGAEDEFLLAGHPDGGLVSVSRGRLPFQQGDPITWWGP